MFGASSELASVMEFGFKLTKEDTDDDDSDGGGGSYQHIECYEF